MMAIQLPGPAERATPSAQQRRGLSYRGARAPDTYSRANIQAPNAASEGGREFGRAVAQAGERLYEASEKDRARLATLETAKAKSYFLRENLGIQAELEQDPDYTGYEKKYNDLSGKAFSSAMAMVQDPEARQMLEYDLKDSGARTAASVKSLSFEKSRHARMGLFEETRRESLDNMLAAKDDPTRKQAQETQGESYIAALKEGLIDVGQMAKIVREDKEEYGEKWASLQPPEALLNAFTKKRDTVKPEDIIRSTIEIEGGYNASDGASDAPVIYGINEKGNPQAHRAAMEITRTEGSDAGKKYAEEFYKKEYFDKYDIGQFPPDVQNVLFDGVINHSVAFNKKMIAAAVQGKTANELIELRRAEYDRLATETKDPVKLAEYKKSHPGWMNRLQKVQADTGKTGTPLDYVPVEKRIKIRNEIVKNTLTTTIENDPLSAIEQINSGAFDNILLSGEKAEYSQKARAEAVTQNNQKMNEPAAFAMRKGYLEPEQLAYSEPEMLSQQITKRLPAIYAMNQKFGSPLEPLTKDEAAGVAQHLSKATAIEKLGYLKSLRDSSTSDEVYRTVLNQIRPNSPVTAWAGSYLDLDKTITVNNWFAQDEAIQPQKVAERLIRGEELINPGKEGEKAKMPMPTREKFTPDFDAYAGAVYRDFPGNANEAYQASVAYYAALSAEEGDYSGEPDSARYRKALSQTLGNVESVNGNDILLPWGMKEDYFVSTLEKNFTATAQKQGLKNWRFDDVEFRNTGISGKYQAYNGTSPLHDKSGQPVFVDVQ